MPGRARLSPGCAQWNEVRRSRPKRLAQRESDWLGYGFHEQAGARRAYWDARAEVAVEPEPRLLFGQLSEPIEDDEALVVLGLHSSGTFFAGVRRGD